MESCLRYSTGFGTASEVSSLSLLAAMAAVDWENASGYTTSSEVVSPYVDARKSFLFLAMQKNKIMKSHGDPFRSCNHSSARFT